MQAEKAKRVAKVQILEDGEPQDLAPRLRPLILALSSLSDSAPTELREELSVQLVVLAHHPRLVATALWIDLLQRNGLSPEALVTDRLAALLEILFVDASTHPSVRLSLLGQISALTYNKQSDEFAQAAYRAATTLAFVAPKAAVPLLFAQVEDDLSVERLAFIGPTEYGIWATPEGSAFIDGEQLDLPSRAPTDSMRSPHRTKAKGRRVAEELESAGDGNLGSRSSRSSRA